MATLVQIKRSNTSATPGSLQQGELAYSYASNTLFIGLPGNTTINIGGQTYTSLLDQASAANGSTTLVRRYANGSAQFQQLDILVGPTSNSHVATKEYVDSAVQANVTLASLNDVNIGAPFSDQNNRILIGNSAGYYVGTSVTGNVSLTNTGIFTIGTSQVTNAMLEGSISNDKLNQDSITVTAGDGLTGGGTVSLGNTITLDVRTGDGMSNTGDYINVDTTVVRTDRNQTLNGFMTFSNTLTISSGDLNILNGNITINGNTTYINVATLNVTDPLIYLASNNTISDTVDIGFIASKNTGGLSVTHTGLARHASDGVYYLFDNLADNGHINNVLDIANSTYALLRANLDAQSANINTLTVDTSLLVTGNATITGTANVSQNFRVGSAFEVTASSGDVFVNDVQLNGNSIKNSAGNTLIEFVNDDVHLPNTTGALDVYSGELRVQGTTFIQANGQNVQVLGDLTVSGGDIISTATANIANVTTTTLNLGGAATTIRIGAPGADTTLQSNLTVTEFSSANTFVSNKTAVSAPNHSNFDGERLRLYDFGQTGRPNYAIGVEGSHIWLGVDSSANTEGWKFYGNTALAARLSANGVLEVSNTIVATNISAATMTLVNPLAVSSGGTGLSSFTANGVFYADTTSSLSFATGTEGQVLQIASGVPAFAMLDGGSF